MQCAAVNIVLRLSKVPPHFVEKLIVILEADDGMLTSSLYENTSKAADGQLFS